MELEKKQEIFDELEILAKKGKLSKKQRKQIYDFIINLDTATDLQKERYILFYGYDITKPRRYNYTEIAKMFNCTPPNIKGTVWGMRSKLLRLEDDDVKIFEKIVKLAK